jgi:hypothetical protein
VRSARWREVILHILRHPSADSRYGPLQDDACWHGEATCKLKPRTLVYDPECGGTAVEPPELSARSDPFGSAMVQPARTRKLRVLQALTPCPTGMKLEASIASLRTGSTA